MKIKVTTQSFSQHPILRGELCDFFPDSTFRDSTAPYDPKTLIDYLSDADGVVLGLEQVDDNVLSQCPNLKIVSKFGVGLDNVDLEACEHHGVAVGWTPGVNRRSVAEMALGFMVSLCRNLYATSITLKGGTWHKAGGFQLSGKTVGIIGLGNTGTETVHLLKPFQCTVLGNDIADRAEFCAEHGVQSVSKEEIFRSADIVSIHTPLTPLTHHLINADTLAQMKSSAFVINTSRGPVANQEDLKQALLNGVIAGAGIDVYEDEPPTDLEFLEIPNLFCTPHIGGNANEAVLAMGRSAIHHLKEFFEK
jgi:phosphoglycerate dehydrogenase-like enzyme